MDNTNAKAPEYETDDLNLLLKEQLLRWLPQQGDHPTPVKGFVLHRRDEMNKAENCFNKPIIAVTVQGAKRSLVGSEEYRYGAGHSLVAGVNMPTLSYITEASPEKPYLVLSLDLDSQLTAQLLEETPLSQPLRNNGAFKRVAVAKSDSAILNAFLRLTKLLDRPERIPALAPLIIREIHFRLLMGEQGEQLRAINTFGTQSNQISYAIDWMLQNITLPLDIAGLANNVNMAPSTFRKHFKAVTTMSPSQYHKHLRLYEAQRLMLVEKAAVTRAAQEVGYESPVQFHREYKRLFGSSPQKNIHQLR